MNSLSQILLINVGKLIEKIPIMSWVFFDTLGLFLLYVAVKLLVLSEFKYNGAINKNYIFFILLFVIIIFVLIYICINYSYGYLIYPCVFSIIATVVVIFFALKQDKSTTLEPTKRKKCPKQKHLNSKVRANNKQDNKINIKGYNTKTDKYRKKNNI